jgi:hypothetical protein
VHENRVGFITSTVAGVCIECMCTDVSANALRRNVDNPAALVDVRFVLHNASEMYG